jgi:hypothetical protein
MIDSSRATAPRQQGSDDRRRSAPRSRGSAAARLDGVDRGGKQVRRESRADRFALGRRLAAAGCRAMSGGRGGGARRRRAVVGAEVEACACGQATDCKAALAIASGALLAGCAATGGTRYPSPDDAVAALMREPCAADSTTSARGDLRRRRRRAALLGDDVSRPEPARALRRAVRQGHHIEQAEPGTATLSWARTTGPSPCRW